METATTETIFEAADFSLARTLESGQFFRWRPEGEGFRIFHAGASFHARQVGSVLRVRGLPAEAARRFFALDHDPSEIRRALQGDPHVGRAMRLVPGLRLLRQDPWECTAAFVTSIVSNIPRITRHVEEMAARYGDPVEGGRSFPAPSRLGPAAELRAMRLGFRARYLEAAARWALPGRLAVLATLPTPALREALMEIPGIGEKVADCVALFAYGRLECFPVDTRIRQAVVCLYFRGRRRPDRRLRDWAARRFGPWAGYAQQYLYVAWGGGKERAKRAWKKEPRRENQEERTTKEESVTSVPLPG